MSDLTLLEKLEYAIRADSTKKAFKHILKRLNTICGEKKDYGTSDVIKVINSFEHPASKRWAYYILKKLYKIAGWEWDSSVLSLPPEEDGEVVVRAPALDRDTIIKMIKNADKLTDTEKVILALSTVWGMRRIEIVKCFEHEDTIDLSGDLKTIYIRTAKKGIRRRFLIPDEVLHIVKMLPEVRKKEKITPFIANQKFHHISIKTTGSTKVGGYGYHAIRRTLIVLLLPPHTDLTESEVFRFMRWSEAMAGAKKILYRYAYTAAEKQWFELDQRIYSRHPFLKYWKEVKP